MRPIVWMLIPLLAAGCTSVTYNCNAAGSCPDTPKRGLTVSIVTPRKAGAPVLEAAAQP